MRIDEESAGMILGQLDQDPPTPSKVDLARAVTDARRRRRTRQVAGYTAVAGATALLLVGTSAVRRRRSSVPGSAMKFCGAFSCR